MIKKVKYSYRGLNQDITKSKHPFEYYFNARNIRILRTDNQTTASLQNEKGNELILTIPDITIDKVAKTISYNTSVLNFINDELINQLNVIDGNNSYTTVNSRIIGHTISRNDVILFTTDNNNIDAVWKMKEIFDNNYELELLYIRNLNFSINYPIQALYNFESDIIQKVYWVDGLNQLRFLNLEHSIANGDLEELIDINSTNINVSGEYDITQPVVEEVTSGGTHTSGRIQYSYNLYRLNGAQTVTSPLSELVDLDEGLNSGGGEINEVVGTIPIVKLTNLDTRYTHIRLYAIKYTSFNEIPSVSLILDRELDNYNEFTYFDDGNSINTLSLSEFLFLGSNVFIPDHIATKDNRMFAASILDNTFDFEIDTRAYSYNNGGVSLLWERSGNLDGNNLPAAPFLTVPVDFTVPEEHDAINPDYDTYMFQANGITIGGEGKYLKYQIVQKTQNQLSNDLKYSQFFKDREIYRIGIEFYNNLGQFSFPKWIADFRAPSGNLEGNFNTLQVELKLADINAYIATLNLQPEQVPVGYRIIRADRTISDRTILCQGSLTGMMVQNLDDVTNFAFWNDINNRENKTPDLTKIPIPFTRGFSNPAAEVNIFPTENLRQMNEGRPGEGDNEIFRDASTAFKRQQSWQYTRMMQMHSPDILFNTGLTFGNGLLLRVKGISNYTQTNKKLRRINNDSLNTVGTIDEINIDKLKFDPQPGFDQFSVIGPINDSSDDNVTSFRSYNRVFGTNQNSNINTTYPIYRSPEITERGQGVISYSGDPEFQFVNSLENLLSDRRRATTGNDDPEINNINSFSHRCLTVVLGNDGVLENTRPTLESIVPADIVDDNGLLMAEIVRDEPIIYSGNIYGGNTYEDKTRSSYIQIGQYSDLTDNIIQIDSPGDTFMQNFRFGRILKTDQTIFDIQTLQISEIVEHNVETSVNLRNRNDLSIFPWDNKLQPTYDEYNQYNRVYSQQPNLTQNTSENFKFKKVNKFDTQIISSKLKVPGETIDSWTDYLENEVMNLDGKYGGISSLVNFNDNIFALQDQGVAAISINPRVQVQGSDGVDIELGRGTVLYDYNYLTTTSGSINKWSTFNSPTGFYYLDTINKAWFKFNGNSLSNLTDEHGLHAYFKNNINYTDLKVDNPLIKQGASGGYDFLNNNAYLTIHQPGGNFTLNFNELTQSFESFHDYIPSMYITKGEKMITTSPDIRQVYEHDKGEYQTFYGTKYNSFVTFQVNPESDIECVFNNIEFNSELYLNDVDVINGTINNIQAWNEYQNSGVVPLIINNNIRRKFRTWRLQIPRNLNSLDRIRGHWVYIKLELDNTGDNNRLVLHDIVVNYTPNYRI